MNLDMKDSTFITFGGMVIAINIALAFVLGPMPVTWAAVPLLMSLTLIPVIEEFGGRQALLVWLSTLLLMCILHTRRSVTLMYACIGYYPVILTYVSPKGKKARMVANLVASILASLFFLLVTEFVFGIPLDQLMVFGRHGDFYYLMSGMLVTISLAFSAIQLCMGSCKEFYYKRLKPVFSQLWLAL